MQNAEELLLKAVRKSTVKEKKTEELLLNQVPESRNLPSPNPFLTPFPPPIFHSLPLPSPSRIPKIFAIRYKCVVATIESIRDEGQIKYNQT